MDGAKRNNSEPISRVTISLYVICGLSMVIILIADLSIPLGVAVGVPYIVVVLLSLWIPNERVTFLVSIICSMFTIAGFFYSPSGGEMWKVVLNRGLALFAIWVTAFLTLERRMLDKQLLNRLSIICVSCKKVRDDEGGWGQIKPHNKEHSEAKFSHGVCPECAKKLHPKYSDDKETQET